MSHITKVKTQIKDLDILKRTLGKIAKNVKEGKHTLNGYYSSESREVEMSCEVVGTFAQTKIGFAKGEDDTYEIICDWYSNSIGKKDFETKLNQTYAEELVKDELDKTLYGGYDINRWVDDEGTVQIEVNYNG